MVGETWTAEDGAAPKHGADIEVDKYGRVVFSESLGEVRYDREETEPHQRGPQEAECSAFPEDHGPDATGGARDGLEVNAEWCRAIFGTGIGATG